MTQKDRKYVTLDYPEVGATSPITSLTGIRGQVGCKCGCGNGKQCNCNDKCVCKIVYITGFYQSESTKTAFVYKGNVKGVGIWHNLNYPPIDGKPVITNLYGPSVEDNGQIKAVGNIFTTGKIQTSLGCLYQGNLGGKGRWSLIVPKIKVGKNQGYDTIVHSTMDNLAVGNYSIYDIVDGKKVYGKLHAFIYNIDNNKFVYMTKPDGKSISAYGIWKNDKNWYTICGGSVDGLQSKAYLVDYDEASKQLSNWQEYTYNNESSAITHFNGIYGNKCNNKYNLAGMTILDGVEIAFAATIKRKNICKFSKKAKWEQIIYPNALSNTSNSVYKNIIIGVYRNDNTSGEAHGYSSF